MTLLRPRRATGPSMEHKVEAIVEELVPTPIYISQRIRMLLIAAMVIAVIWLFSMAPSVPRLLVIGATVALILSFPVRLLQRWMPRGIAILIVVSSTILTAVIGVAILIPFAINEISRFLEQMPELADALEEQARDLLMQFYRRGWLDQHPDTVIEDVQGNLLERGEEIASTLLNNAVATLTRTFSIVITTFGVIFVATYLLIDIPRFKEKFVLSFSPSYRPDAAQLWITIGESLSRYLAGLMISIVIQGAMATIGLIMIGVPYAVVLGVWMSATAILPYVGAFLGAIPAILVALTIGWETALIVAGLYILINQLEGNLITPRIQGSAVRVHPLLIFMSVIGGTQIAGFLGAILAVPTLAVVRVLTGFLWDRLRVRHAQDTVLVALGGDDDGAEEWTEEVEAEVIAAQVEEQHRRLEIQTGDDTDITIDAEVGSSITINGRDDRRQGAGPTRRPGARDATPAGLTGNPDGAQAIAAGYRARPTVRRRAVRRTHAPVRPPRPTPAR